MQKDDENVQDLIAALPQLQIDQDDHATQESSGAEQPASRKELDKLQMPKWYQARRQNLSKRQRATLRDIWPRYGRDYKTLAFGEPINWDALFARDSNDEDDETAAPSAAGSSALVLDVGFGVGDSILELAVARPHERFLGAEIYRAGHAFVAEACAQKKLTNVRLFGGEVTKFLQRYCGNGSFDRVQIFFPDPFPGSETDMNCRLMSANFFEMLAPKLVINGVLHVASDVGFYVLDVVDHLLSAPNDASWRIRRIGQSGGPENPRFSEEAAAAVRHQRTAREDEYRAAERMGSVAQQLGIEIGARPAWRPETKFEAKALQEGRFVWDLEVEHVHVAVE